MAKKHFRAVIDGNKRVRFFIDGGECSIDHYKQEYVKAHNELPDIPVGIGGAPAEPVMPAPAPAPAPPQADSAVPPQANDVETDTEQREIEDKIALLGATVEDPDNLLGEDEPVPAE